MREIKFRAWDTTNKKMYSAVCVGEYSLEQLDRLTRTDDPYTKFMQYTGLKDKNGVEIYGGDILANGSGRTGKVLWLKLGGMWDCEPVCCEGNPEGFQCNLWGQCVEVVGNIYESPELLNAKA